MSDSTPTLAEVFSLTAPGNGAGAHPQWEKFQGKLTSEMKGIRWTAALPDLLPKVASLFDVELPQIMVTAWKKIDVLTKLLEESAADPQQETVLELAEHTISSEHRPYVEIRIKNVPLPKRIEFTIQLSMTLKGFILAIRDGAIRELRTGTCEIEGKVDFEGVTILEKKLEPLTLPGSIPLQSRAATTQ